VNTVLSRAAARALAIAALVALTVGYIFFDNLGGSAEGSPINPTPPAVPTISASTPTTTSRVQQPSPSIAVDPASAAVGSYYDAINRKDYQAAWNLGGENLGSSQYSDFAAGYSDTEHVDLTITSTNGSIVNVRLLALHTNGRSESFTGTYQVVGGNIVSGDIRRATR
jgi:hypothetical protein